MPDARSVSEHYADLAKTYADRANPACVAAFKALAKRWLPKGPVLEMGCGSMPIMSGCEGAIGCDYSVHMLRAAASDTPRICADAAQLPFVNDLFAGAIAINVLEHVPTPEDFIAEAARVLKPGSVFVTVTPNGNLEWLLDWIERMNLKLPEGPHEFLTTSRLRDAAQKHFTLSEHKTFLAFPAGPPAMVNLIDSIAPFGLFQYLVAIKK